MKRKYYYFCAHKDIFGHDCQVVDVKEGDNLQKKAQTWGKINGYKEVWVYSYTYEYVDKIEVT